jgi:hypothetical protein
MRFVLRPILSGLLILVMGRPLGAQQPVTIDAGIAAAHFPNDDATAAGPYLRLSASTAFARLFASVDAGALGTFGASAGYATLRGGARSSLGTGFSAVLDGELSGVAGSGSTGAAGTGIMGARAMWSAPEWGAWFRGSADLSQRTSSTFGGVGTELFGWRSWPLVQLSASLIHERTFAELYTGRFRTGFVGKVPVVYSEGTAILRAESDRASLDASFGVRRDRDAAHLWEPSYAATAALWTGESVALILSATHQLPDWVRGADAVDEVSVGVRIRQSTPQRTRAMRVLPIVQVAEGGSSMLLRVRAAGASTVDVMGDFTDWEPRALARSGDVFEVPSRLTSGSHRMVVRIDGGPWRAAVNTPVVDDELGGKVGLLVVP